MIPGRNDSFQTLFNHHKDANHLENAHYKQSKDFFLHETMNSRRTKQILSRRQGVQIVWQGTTRATKGSLFSHNLDGFFMIKYDIQYDFW